MGQRDGFSSQDIEKINRMYNCKGSSGQQSITSVTTQRPISGSGIIPIAVTPTRPSPIAGNTGPVLFPSNPPRPSGNNFESMSGSSLSQRPSVPTYRPTQNPIANFFGNLISGFSLGDEEEGVVNGTQIEQN